MTIRAKVLGALGVLMLLAAIEAALVAYVQRDTEFLASEVDRLSAVLHDHSSAWRALIGMKTADRGWRMSGAPVLERRYDEWVAVYESNWPELVARVRDDQQRARLVEVEAAVAAWRRDRVGTPLPPGASPQALAEVVEASDADFAHIESLMIAFEEREIVLLAEVQARSADHRRNATLAMLLIPALAGALMIYMFVRAKRTLLDPLIALTSSASRIAYGDYRDIRPTARPDEIGMLQNAFAHMGRAIADRERDLTAALEGSRTMTARYAEASAEAQIAHTDLLATLQTVPAALLILDADGRVRLQNRAAADLLGVEPGDEDARRRYWARFRYTRPDGSTCPPEELATRRALRGEEVFAQELDVHHPDGRVVPIVLSAAPLVARSGDRLGAVAAFQDITPLREVDRLKDEFVSVVSHELRTPLTSIRGSLQLVMGDEDAVPGEDHRDLLTVALNNCERLIRIINDILDVSKIEAGHLEVRRRPAALSEIVSSSVESVAGLAASGGIALDVHVPHDLPSVYVDPERMEQVVVNLLSNAIKFTEIGRVVLHLGLDGD
ncbi:MAG: histidine kinase dimerization/phospho-acceptor domain-containing protein, partial [Vicinamibacteria bacterium]